MTKPWQHLWQRLRFGEAWQPLDWGTLGLAVLLTVAIGVTLWMGDRTQPVVRHFSWEGRTVRAQDRFFVLEFNRPMNRESVQANLKIEPELPGKFSWSGLRMAYTPLAPAPYGQTFTLSLANAFDRFAAETGEARAIAPFTGRFTTPPPAFLYVDRDGRLVYYDLTTQQSRAVTTGSVVDFKPMGDGQRAIVAIEGEQGPLDRRLYEVSLAGGEPQLRIDSGDFQNLKFDVSPDGNILLVQRLNLKQPGQYGLWAQQGDTLKPLNNQPGGDFVITPDSESVAIAQGEGIAVLPLVPDAKPLDFLPQFGLVLDFGRSGRRAAAIRFNKDFSRSLFVLDDTGNQTEVARLKGSILAAQFHPTETVLYALLAEAVETETTYREEPYLVAFDLATKTAKRLVDLTGRQSPRLSVAPDGRGLLLDTGTPRTADGPPQSILHLDLTTNQWQPLVLGKHPQWMP
ncbi:MAG: Ig-like domain-containing protein [Pseudanabaenaceae cyanobacterium]